MGSLKELPGALPRLGAEAGPHVLDALLGVGVEEHHNGIPLSVVQAVHCIRGDVQHRMLVPVNDLFDSVQANDAGVLLVGSCIPGFTLYGRQIDRVTASCQHKRQQQ